MLTAWLLMLAAQTPVISPAVTFDVQQVGPAFGEQDRPRIAFDGTNYFVVWMDVRSGENRVVGTRVSPSGTVLDGSGITLASGLVLPRPAVAFDGTNYLVAWETAPSSLPIEYIFAARVSPAGALLDLSPLVISGITTEQDIVPNVGCASGTCVVTFDRYSTREVLAVRVGGGGVVLDVPPVQVAPNSNDFDRSNVGADPSGFFVVWSEGLQLSIPNQVHGSRLGFTGAFLNAPGVALTVAPQEHWPTVGGGASMARGSANWLLTWEDRGGAGDVLATRVTPTGTVLDPLGLPIGAGAGAQVHPRVVANGADWYLVWQDNLAAAATVYGTRVSAAGAVLDPTGRPLGTGSLNTASVSDYGSASPTVARGSTNMMVAWAGDLNGDNDVFGVQVSTTTGDPVGSPFLISVGGSSQTRPAVAAMGGTPLVSWTDQVLPASDIRAARVSADGQVLDAPSVLVSGAANGQRASAVACSAAGCLAVWEDERNGVGNFDIYGSRLSPAGALLDPAGIAISTGARAQREPAVAAGTSEFLVAWEDDRVTQGVPNLHVARVSPAGTVLDVPAVRLAGQAQSQRSPALAFDGLVYWLAWADSRAGGSRVYLERVTNLLASLDGRGLLVPASGGTQTNPTVACGAAGCAVGWAASGLYASRFSSDAGTLDPVPLLLSSPAMTPVALSASSDGQRYLFAWQEQSSMGPSRAAAMMVPAAADAGTPFVVAAGAGQVRAPSVAAVTLNRFAVAYEEQEADGGAVRAHLVYVTLQPQPPGSSCAVATECACGNCTQGTCCGAGLDGGAADGGLTDGGLSDGGLTDGGLSDGGRPEDGGTTLVDGGPWLPDGGLGRRPPLAVGCGCGVAGGAGFALFAVAAMLSRRRRGWRAAGGRRRGPGRPGASNCRATTRR